MYFIQYTTSSKINRVAVDGLSLKVGDWILIEDDMPASKICTPLDRLGMTEISGILSKNRSRKISVRVLHDEYNTRYLEVQSRAY